MGGARSVAAPRRAAPPAGKPPTGSLEQDSLSLRQLAANPYTFEGQMERLSIEAEMSHQPGWRGTALRVYLIGVLGLSAVVFIAFFVAHAFGR